MRDSGERLRGTWQAKILGCCYVSAVPLFWCCFEFFDACMVCHHHLGFILGGYLENHVILRVTGLE